MLAVAGLTPAGRAALAFAGGLVAALSLPPWGWWPLAIVGLALVAATFTAADGPVAPRTRALIGLGFGLGTFLPGLWWVTEFHVVGYVVLTLLETSFFVAGALLVRSPHAFPGAVVLAEATRTAVPFGGLPLGGLALGQAGGPFVAAARLGGSLLIIGVVAAIANALVARTRATAAIAAAGVALAATGWIAPDARDRKASEPLDVALVQGGGRRGFRAVDDASSSEEVLAAHLRVSRNLAAPLDLVLWPENAIDVPSIDGSAAGEALAAVARRVDATVVAGVTEDAGPDGERFGNVAVVWLPDGTVGDRYTKVRRVPFGEYVPGRSLIEHLVDLSVLPRDAVAGHGPGVVRTPRGPMAVSISYEVFFAERTRSGVLAGGGVLLVPTNAASFSTSQVPAQEVAAARLRAWETGRWVLQSAPTGYSAVIDWRGRVLARSVLGEPEILTADVPYRVGRTVYTVTGDRLVVLGAALIVLLPLHRRRRVRGSAA